VYAGKAHSTSSKIQIMEKIRGVHFSWALGHNIIYWGEEAKKK